MFKMLGSSVEDLDDKGIVTVAANAFGNVDADMQISMPGSFRKTITEFFPRLKWLLNHDRTILLGVPMEASEDGQYLKVRGQLNMKKQVSRDVYEDYKLWAEHGKTLEHSVAVSPVKADPWEKGKPQKVYEWKWTEYSTLTAWGANENTPMLEIKGAKDIAEQLSWLEIQLRKGNYTDERFKQIEQSIQTLRSLTADDEPPGGTQAKSEPIAVNTIKHFLNQL